MTAAFDLLFGHDRIQWETGQASGGNNDGRGSDAARVGWSNGTGTSGTVCERIGAQDNGAFLDGGPMFWITGSTVVAPRTSVQRRRPVDETTIEPSRCISGHVTCSRLDGKLIGRFDILPFEKLGNPDFGCDGMTAAPLRPDVGCRGHDLWPMPASHRRR